MRRARGGPIRAPQATAAAGSQAAQRIGTRRETVSREMAEMARGGLLTVGRRAIVLHRPDALQAEIEARLQQLKNQG